MKTNWFLVVLGFVVGVLFTAMGGLFAENDIMTMICCFIAGVAGFCVHWLGIMGSWCKMGHGNDDESHSEMPG
jgi:hypothetical protein